jgi:hypothetical protein
VENVRFGFEGQNKGSAEETLQREQKELQKPEPEFSPKTIPSASLWRFL